MAAKPPYLALIANNLQRFDIADHRLLGDAMFNLSQEQLKDLISDDGYGRVFSGFTPTWTAGTSTVNFTTGVAVNSDGELLVRDTAASHTITPVNSKVYGVYAVIEETVDTALVSRRKWNGTVEVVDNSVPVKTFKKVSLGEVSDTFSGSFTVGSLFPLQVSGKTILPLAAVTVNGSGVKTFYDCRRMWAVDGNVQPSIGLPSELPHDFAEEVVDPPTLGITGVRSFFRALADRVQAVTGEDLWWSNPPITLNALWAMLGTTGTGVKRVRTVADTAALTALVGAVDKDVAYSQAQNSLYQYSASSTATVAGIRVVSGNGGTGRWFIHNRGATDVAYGYPGLGSDGALSKTDVVKTSNIQNLAITSNKLNVVLPYDVQANLPDTYLGNFFNFRSSRPWVLNSTGHTGGQYYLPAQDKVCNVYKNSSLIGTITFKTDGSFVSSLPQTAFLVDDVLRVELQGGTALQSAYFTLYGYVSYSGGLP